MDVLEPVSPGQPSGLATDTQQGQVDFVAHRSSEANGSTLTEGGRNSVDAVSPDAGAVSPPSQSSPADVDASVPAAPSAPLVPGAEVPASPLAPPAPPSPPAPVPEIEPRLKAVQVNAPCVTVPHCGLCGAAAPSQVSTMLEGDPTKTYRVKLRIEGVVEPKTYVGGRSDGAFWQEGGAPAGNGWATFALQVSDPPQTYFVNRTNQVGIYTFPIGYEKEIVMASNAQITLSTHSIDGRQAAANQFVRVTPVGITALR